MIKHYCGICEARLPEEPMTEGDYASVLVVSGKKRRGATRDINCTEVCDDCEKHLRKQILGLKTAGKP